ncbi:MAG: aminotransferase [Janthinobacterium lividum]
MPDLTAELSKTRADYEAFKARGLKLDMTRGKPSPEQLSLSDAMLVPQGNRDTTTAAGEDARNYGGNLQGLPEVRALFAEALGLPAEAIVLGNNSSLALMHDCIVWALLKGVPGSERPWSREAAPAFICPVPGYDRHFGLAEDFGFRLLPVPLTGQGPDMDAVEALAADPAVKGMWCVPRYSNPTGETYADEIVRRLATMTTGASDFRLFWDDAYAVHHLTERQTPLASILDLTRAAGHPDRAFCFASTSKVTLAGAGVALFASSPANVAWYLARAGRRTIGSDKLNQLRHLRFLRDAEGLRAHMDRHRTLIAPKFDSVLAALERRLGGTDLARWSRPEGGYFVSVDALPGTAGRVVELAKAAGLALTPAGATWPQGRDPDDSNLRLAPTFPALRDVEAAAEGIAICIALAGLERQTAEAATAA